MLSGEDSAASAAAQALYANALRSPAIQASRTLLRGALDQLRASLGPDHLRTVDAEIALARLELMITMTTSR
jgi:hypothetical protein